MVTLVRTNSENQDFAHLLRFLDADLKIRDGDDHDFFNQYNKLDTIKNVVVAYLNKKPVGCGAFKFFEKGVAEIKRMYTHEGARGNKVATKVLMELEKWAQEEGFNSCVLETGFKMPEAIGLYTKNGYNRTANYGQYIGVAASRCFKKELK